MVHLSNKSPDKKALHVTNSYRLYFKKWKEKLINQHQKVRFKKLTKTAELTILKSILKYSVVLLKILKKC